MMTDKAESNRDVESQHKNKFVENDAGDGTNRFDQQEHGLKPVLSVLSCAIALFLIAVDQTIVFTTIETIGNKWGEYQKSTWVASGYMLTMAMFVQIWGKCSIYFGRKPSLLLAISIFELGSLICGVAPSMDALIVGRVIAGIGGGGIQVLVFIVVSELVPISRRSLMFAILGVIFSVASIVGPVMGGAFTDNVTWRWCYYINLPLGGCALVLLILFFKPPSSKFTWKEKFSQIDYIGSGLLMAGIVLILMALTVGGQQLPWSSGGTITLFVLGGVISIIFIIWNFKWSKRQVIPTDIIVKKSVDAPCFHIFLCFLIFMAFCLYFTTYFQVVRGYDAIKAGVHFFPLVISLVLSSISTGVLVRKTRYIMPFAILSGVTSAVGLGVSSLLTETSSLSQTIGYMILPGISVGTGLQASLISSQVNAPKSMGGMIMTTSFTNFSRALGGAFGSVLAQVIYNSSLHNKATAAIKNNPAIFGDIDLGDVDLILSSPRVIRTLPNDAQSIILKAVMESIRNVFYFCTGIASLMFVVTLLYSPKRLPSDAQVEHKTDYEPKHDATTQPIHEPLDTSRSSADVSSPEGKDADFISQEDVKLTRSRT